MTSNRKDDNYAISAAEDMIAFAVTTGFGTVEQTG